MTNRARKSYSKARTPARVAKSAEQAAQFEALSAQLADGIDALSTTEAWQAHLDFQAKLPRFSFGNCMLIALQCPQATMVMKYGDKKHPEWGGWVSLGRYARAGEKALRIRKPNFRLVEDPDAGQKVRRLCGFISVPVFDVSQTDGDPLPEDGVQLLQGEAPEGMLDRVVAFIEAQGFTVEFVPECSTATGANGVTYWAGNVEIATYGRSTLQQLKTAIHEAAHILLHKGQEIDHRGVKELEAESTAYMVAKTLGLDTSDYSFGYVLTWMGGDPELARKVIREHGDRIQKAFVKVLDHLTGTAVQAGTQDADESAEPLMDVAA